ncbi:hypothetical protein [Bradyrhizobium sp. Ai1a-2]|uniref:hypothetical protein n=1 Tax=Bradyrhizobium sp. Ai1a-2 TaxID=196490 RepID=UPI000404EE61|nr:hypothetical protein [Bradyrhizobium sp. Ai1a-2]
MAKLDAIVVVNLAQRLFQPERLMLILGNLANAGQTERPRSISGCPICGRN